MKKHLRPVVDLGNGTSSVTLAGGKTAFIDTSLAWKVSPYHWYEQNGDVRGAVNRKKVLLHRWLLDASDDTHVTHLDGDGLNNRISNLAARDKRAPYQLDEETWKVPLTRGKYALVDPGSVTLVGKYTWFCDAAGYARTKIDGVAIPMHRLLLNAPRGVEVDHINGDRADNRLSNLRLCNRSENQKNKKVGKGNSSGYKGVSWHKGRKAWAARIMVDRVAKSLGYFETALEAAVAYDRACNAHFGEFARPNFPLTIAKSPQ